MYSHEDPVFRQKEVLFPDYIPDHLPHREKEIKAVSSLINSALKDPAGIVNIFIYGPPGTGKTASIKFIFRKLEEETAAFPVYINCFRINTRMGVIYAIIFEFFRKVRPTRRIPSRRGVAYDELFDLLVSELRKSRIFPVICFDEVDHLLPRGAEVLYDLSRLKEESIPVQLIMITNDQFIFMNVDPRIRSSLRPVEEIPYRAYTLDEMREIIKLRVEFAFQKDVVDEKAVDYLAEVACEMGGDVRIARETLLRAGELAKKDGKFRVTVEHIKQALSESQFAKAKSMVEQLSSKERKIISLIPENGIFYPEFYELYRKVYPSGVRDRMLRYYLERLARYGLITMERRGIGGSYFIRLNVPRKVLNSF
ncbi:MULTISPECIES: Cdc6/Cdc18 family protein [unclassified Archaeoglobus]|jgi:cell division control protein 6|uniref:Cdc6/Cdc18 family protein n=2 Tax=Archaeoglobus TaxID=2233 RepID=UPI0025C26200|nr:MULTISPECIES: AAA family ATPase [unclassified Archaeoglobus]